MLKDTADILVRGGHGGSGNSSFKTMRGTGPDGGNGGTGGNVYFKGSTDITLLNQFSRKQSFFAENGIGGGKNRKSGRDGVDTTLILPIGTHVIDRSTGKTILEITSEESILICKGGKGGKGNYEFRRQQSNHSYSQDGLPGDELKLTLVLKLIADIGLIGLPNAGKSSLLNELTNARAKTANYAFTTLSPNLGVCAGKVLADIPGLIEGAASGKGLGVTFLKHIEKVSTLLHCISCENEDPLKAYKTVRSEMGKYSESLLTKPEVILLTKSDLVDDSYLKDAKSKLKGKAKKIITVSIFDADSLEELRSVV